MWEKIKAFLTLKDKKLSDEELKELETIVGGEDKKEDKVDDNSDDKKEDKLEDKKEEDKKEELEDKVIEILQDGWLDDKGNVNLEKINDETLRDTIKGLIDKSTAVETNDNGFNPAQPNKHTGYKSGMSFEEALELENSMMSK